MTEAAAFGVHCRKERSAAARWVYVNMYVADAPEAAVQSYSAHGDAFGATPRKRTVSTLAAWLFNTASV